jgi:hypothetical protein
MTHLALSAQDFEPRVLAAVKRDNIRSTAPSTGAASATSAASRRSTR